MSDPGDLGSGSELRHTRDRLAEEVAKLQWDLGGLTYEMAIRDHFRPDVLMRRAATLQERDAELAEVERLLHAHETSVAGSCGSCGAVRSRGAVFCWQCGAQLMERVEAETSDGSAPVLDNSGKRLIATDVHAEINRLAARHPHAPEIASPEPDPSEADEPATAGPAAPHPAPDIQAQSGSGDLGRPVEAGP
jgi:hypothetical protein